MWVVGLMLQARLWPLRIIDLYPHNAGTARLRMKGIGDDGMPYFLKGVTPEAPGVPATELLCSGMANAVGLAVPYFHIGYLPDTEEPVFASRQESGLSDSIDWFNNLVRGGCPANVSLQLSAWFAFDLFINNPDRHLNNYLCRDMDGTLSLHGFDFSEAWLQEGWPPSLAMRPGCNTLVNRQVLTQLGIPLDQAVALAYLRRLELLPEDWMESALTEVPLEWLEEPRREELRDWWRRDRGERINHLRQDIDNGAYN